jgi:hypothetical protein
MKYNKDVGIFQKYKVYDANKQMKRYTVFPGCEKFSDNPDELNECGKDKMQYPPMGFQIMLFFKDKAYDHHYMLLPRRTY